MNIIEKLGVSPGRWIIEPHGDNETLFAREEYWQHGLNLVSFVEQDWNWENNKRIIIAAPEMLKILISIRAGLLPYRDESGVREVCLHNFPLLEPIITKATGKCWEEIEKMIKE
jgi:hypothetical protein